MVGTRIKQWARAESFWLAILVAIFLLSRLIVHLVGVRFDMTYFGRAWQFIDPVLLKTQLLSSIWYLHSQPPLFNLLMGVVIKIFPVNYALVFQLVFLLAGLLLTLGLYEIMKNLKITRWLNITITLIFILSSSVILSENLFFYDYLVMVILLATIWILQQSVNVSKLKVNMGWLTIFFFGLAILELTRSVFHVLWFIVLLAVLLYFYRRDWRTVILAAVIPLILIVGWYGKNYYYFGSFGASSWMGMGLYKTAMFVATDADKQKLFNDKIIAAYFPSDPFAIDLSQINIPGFTKPAILSSPIIGSLTKSSGLTNFNYYGYLTLSKMLMRDFVSIIQYRPVIYAKGVVGTTVVFFAPVSNYLSSNLNGVYSNYEAIKYWDKIYGSLVYGQPMIIGDNKLINYFANVLNIKPTQAWRLLSPGLLVVLVYLIAIVHSVRLVVARGALVRYGLAIYLSVIFMLLNILYVSAVGILCEAGENQRHRFMIEPFCWILFAHFIQTRFLSKPKEL